MNSIKLNFEYTLMFVIQTFSELSLMGCGSSRPNIVITKNSPRSVDTESPSGQSPALDDITNVTTPEVVGTISNDNGLHHISICDIEFNRGMDLMLKEIRKILNARSVMINKDKDLIVTFNDESSLIIPLSDKNTENYDKISKSWSFNWYIDVNDINRLK